MRTLTKVWPASLIFDTLLERVRPELPGAEDDVVSTDGKSLKGQRNLDAVADKVVGKLLDLFKR